VSGNLTLPSKWGCDKKLVAKHAHGMLKHLPTNENTNGQLPGFALSILFKLEKPPIEHLEGFIPLPKKGGEL
jgi:hypothetical protein